jgi:hypothetical protein
MRINLACQVSLVGYFVFLQFGSLFAYHQQVLLY